MGSTWLNSADAAYPAMARIYSIHESIKDAANQGYYVHSGANVAASATAGKLKVNTGTVFALDTEVNIIATIDNIDCISSVDATNPRWAIVELDGTSSPGSVSVALNVGAAAANPVPPTLTTGRVPLALIYLQNASTAVDALTSTANAKSKIIDCRQFRPRPARAIGLANDWVSNIVPTISLASILNTVASNGPMDIFAKTAKLGDTFALKASGLYVNDVSSTLQICFVLKTDDNATSYQLTNYTTASLTYDPTRIYRQWVMDCTFSIGSNGASWLALSNCSFLITGATASNGQTSGNGMTTGGGLNGDWAIRAGQTIIDANVNMYVDVQAKVSSTSPNAYLRLHHFSVVKYPTP